jgi:LysR family transcriptional activator of dmlA
MSGDWLFRESLDNGSLVRVLPEWEQPANVNAVTSTRSSQSAKVRIFLECLRDAVKPWFTPA